MHYFPPIRLQDRLVFLPLSRGAHEFLAGAIVGEQVQPALLATKLSRDPALALFVAAWHAEAFPSMSMTLDDIAQGMSGPSLRDTLIRSGEADERNEGEFLRLAARSYRRMADWLQHSAAAGTAVEENGEVVLAAILSAAPEWCERSINKKIDPNDAERYSINLQPLQAWLADGIGSGRFPAGSFGREVDEVSAVDAELVQQHWSQSCEIQNWLPALATKLQRLGHLESQFEERLHTDKLAAMKELAYGASHEINNPLANISSRAQTLLHEEADPERRETLAAINRQAFRAYEMIADMMMFANPPEMKPSAVNLSAVMQTVVGEMTPDADALNNAIRISDIDEELEVFADPTQLAVAVRALLRNSLEAVGTGGNIRVAGWHDASSGVVHIEVQDDGPGISKSVREHLFDPFYSGREAGRGLGFGLSKAWQIMSEHGGSISVDSIDEQPGACFTLRFPIPN